MTSAVAKKHEGREKIRKGGNIARMTIWEIYNPFVTTYGASPKCNRVKP